MNRNDEIAVTEALLMAYINKELDVQLATKVEHWIKSEGANKKQFDRLKKAWELSGKIKPEPVVVDVDKAWDHVLDEINKKDQKIIPIRQKTNLRRVWTVAAAVVVLIGAFSVFQMLSGEVEQVTRFAQNSGLVDGLPDGSVVTLNANTSIVYPKEFVADERRVALKGEAFFDIERDEEKPFIVDLPFESYVKVLGTSFNIKSVETDSITEVFVKTGKVEFGTATDTLILVAGEKGIFNKNSGKIRKVTDLHAGVKETYWVNKELVFQSTPLHEVVEILNIVFEDEVVLGCESVKEKLIQSDHSDESLESTLETLCLAHQLKLSSKEENNKTIYILNCND